MKERSNQVEAVVVGSVAMAHHFPDFPRIPKDKDVIIWRSTYESILKENEDIEHVRPGISGLSSIVKFNFSSKPFEYLFADGQESLELILNELCDPSCDHRYAPIPILYSLRKAHIHFPVKFDKHIKDFMFLREKLREKKGISLEVDLMAEGDLLDEYPTLTYLHFKETEKRVGKLKTPKMNQTTEEFFGKSKKYVKSYFVHDNMHKAIAEMHAGSPIYESIIKEGKEVETDHELWKKLSLQEKIWCVLEEVYVIALERKILPDLMDEYGRLGNPQWDEKSAFDWALFRVCTTLCDGFFREFAVRAYDEIHKQYNPNYVNVFFSNISKYEEIEKE